MTVATAVDLEELAGRLGPVPGLELAVVHEGSVVVAGGAGVRAAGSTEPAGPRTLFAHGSCGKAYTALLAAVLAERGVLDLDAPVRRLVPELRLPDPVVAERVTLRDLLSHRSGLGRNDLVWILDPTLSREDLVARLEHLPLGGDLRLTMGYSNFGYALAGLAIGRATGSTWEEQLREVVLRPLGMARTFAELSPFLSDPDRAAPHVVRSGAAAPTADRVMPGTAPAGLLVSCAEDSTRWLLAQLGRGTVGGEEILPAGAFDQCHRLTVGLPSAETGHPELQLYGYALGWLVARYRGRAALWHSGGVDGFSTQTLLLPEEGIGAVASANVFPTNLPLAAVLDAVDRLLDCGGSGPGWFERLSAEPGGEGAETAAEPAAEAGRAPTGPAHPLADYAGTYHDPGYGDLQVEASGAGLTVGVAGTPWTATHRGYETWDLRYEPLEVDATLTFVTGPDGTVHEAQLPFEQPDRPVCFRRRAEQEGER